MRKEPERAPLPNIAKALAALLLTAALLQPRFCPRRIAWRR